MRVLSLVALTLSARISFCWIKLSGFKQLSYHVLNPFWIFLFPIFSATTANCESFSWQFLSNEQYIFKSLNALMTKLDYMRYKLFINTLAETFCACLWFSTSILYCCFEMSFAQSSYSIVSLFMSLRSCSLSVLTADIRVSKSIFSWFFDSYSWLISSYYALVWSSCS